MKILQLNLERGWRGGERQTLWTMARLRERGCEVELLARAGEPLAQRARAEGFEVHTCAGGAAVALAVGIHARRFDILHAQTAGALTWAVLLRALHRRPIVATRRVAFDITRRSTLLKYRRTDRLAAISQAAAAPLRAHGMHDIAIIPSAVQAPTSDPSRVAAFIAQHNLAGKRVLGTVAALTSEKDPELLVDAMAQIETPNTVLVHFGQGRLSESIAQRIAQRGLQARYLLAGFEPHVEQLYPMMDAFVLSSRMEGLGSSALDAFLARVPVASTAAGGLNEALADGRGLLSPIGDARALAVNIDRLLSERDDAVVARQAQVERACQWVQRTCSVHAMGDAYLALFEDLLREKTRST